jgi:hypothetical protein
LESLERAAEILVETSDVKTRLIKLETDPIFVEHSRTFCAVKELRDKTEPSKGFLLFVSESIAISLHNHLLYRPVFRNLQSSGHRFCGNSDPALLCVAISEFRR